MPDPLSERYRELLEGSYACVDRVVLNAYFRMGHSGGGFRAWWRKLEGSEEHLDNTQARREGQKKPHLQRGRLSCPGLTLLLVEFSTRYFLSPLRHGGFITFSPILQRYIIAAGKRKIHVKFDGRGSLAFSKS